MSEPRPTPAIVIVGERHLHAMLREFTNRYGGDYALHPSNLEDFIDTVLELKHTGVAIAMVVAEFSLGEHTAAHLFHKLQVKLPTARKVVLVPRDEFRASLEPLRASLAQGEIDAYLMLPSGLRDEEFHAAIAESLSEWGWSVATPEVVLVEIVADDGGGGIFATLEYGEAGRRERDADGFERLFTTPTRVDLAALCRAHGVDYALAADADTLRELVRARPDGLRVVHVPIRATHRADREALRAAAASVDGR